MARSTFSGPVASTNGFEGDITGNVTGDVTGDVTGNLEGDVSTESLTVGASGSEILSISSGTIAVDLASINDGDVAVHDATLTGAAAGDIVILIPPADLTAGLIVGSAYVSGADTVSFAVANHSGGAVDEASADWVYLWIDLTA